MDPNCTSADDFVPRDYQHQLKEICLARNTIIYLPTGAGKTHIALMVIKEMGKDLVKPLTEGGKRTFFVVNTVALAKQQAELISRNIPYDTTIYTSDRNVDTWKHDRWLEEFAKFQVVVCTCQILLDVLKHGYLSIAHINLLIFDECHHGVGEHPMHGVMEQFLRVPQSQHPRVIGLSGMLLYKQLKSADQVSVALTRLENTFNATIATVGCYDTYTEVCRFSTDPNEFIVTFTTPSCSIYNIYINKVDNFVETINLIDLPKYQNQTKSLELGCPKPLKEIKKYFRQLKTQLTETGLYGAKITVLGLIVQFELDKRTADHIALRLVYRSCITFCESLLHELERVMVGLDEEQKLQKFSSIRLRQLIKQLELLYEGNGSKNTKTLIFVKERMTAKVLYHILKIYYAKTDKANIIVPDFMVGSNSFIPESIKQILNNKKNRMVLERFKKNETNIIVTTNVLEEGIDLQMCNTVIKYDFPESFASYVQSKGRARMKDSKYLIMINLEKKDDFLQSYRLYKEIENELKMCLIGKTINRPEPLAEEVRKELLNELIPPFFTKKGAKLDALSAIQLLNRYCMGMPRDTFTNINVTWERVSCQNEKIVVKVLLPMQSTVREKVSGNPMATVKLAKRSAAFNACVKLYNNGELNEHLIPIDTQFQLNKLQDVYFKHWMGFEEESDKQAGTKKKLRFHTIQYPRQTRECFPQANQPCFIYILRIAAGFDTDCSNENVNIFRSLYNSANNFAIMTTKPLPALAKMKFFVTLGLIHVQLDATPIRLLNAGTETELALLRQFHMTVFRDILGVWKPFFVCDFSNEENSFLMVPMKASTHIDWDLIKEFQYLKQAPSEVPTTARERLQFNADQYRHRVVLPWYKNNREQAYVVTAVHEHMTPESPFPNPEYSSYADYFERAYHVPVVKKNQFLIEVKGITSSLNRLNPGSEDYGKSTRAKHWHFQELLIPELCHNYHFPADYWLKATILPSALHRINYLLLAETIRVNLATMAGVGCLENRIIEDVEVEFNMGTEKQQNITVPSDSESEEDEDDDDSVDELMPAEDLGQLARSQVNSFAVEIPTPWRKDEEPVDTDRFWDSISKSELDYYIAFLNRFSNLSILQHNHEKESEPLDFYTGALSGTRRNVEALMDAPFDEKFNIKLLKLNIENTAHINLQQKNIIMALTAKSSSDVFNLERFELLGDGFLKFTVSLYLIKYHKDLHEGFLTAIKGKIVSNRNLVYCAMNYNLPGVLKIHKFDPKNDWQPPLATVPSKIKEAMQKVNHSARVLYRLSMSEEEILTGEVHPNNCDDFITQLETQNDLPDTSPMQNFLSQQVMNDKTPADAIEALLGACVSAVGINRSFKLFPFFGILPSSYNIANILSEKIESQRLKTNICLEEVDSFLTNHSRIERIIGYVFKDRTYLLQALTHSSYPTNRITGSYQQLEFLGDAVLDFLISAFIYEQNPTMDPGQLTDLRSALVNNVTLACLIVRYGLHLFILSESAPLSDAINNFVSFQEQHKHEVTDQVNFLMEETDRKMAEFVDVPKALGDVFESLVGAVFLDSGNNLEITWKVIYGLMHKEILAFSQNTPIQIVRQLYEFKPACYPSFSRPIVDEDTVMVKLRYKIRNQKHEAYGFGLNRDSAKRAAAKIAMRELIQQYRTK